MPNPEPNTANTAVRNFRYGYISPRWLYVLDDMTPIVKTALWIALFTVVVLGVVLFNPFGFSDGQRLVAFVFGFGLTNAGTRIGHAFLIQFRGGYGLRPNGSDQLIGRFAPGQISFWMNDRWLTIDAEAPHQFLMREHSERIDEARAEERARSYGYGMQPDYFRRSFEVVLDHGLTRTRLAEVAFEVQARDMVRWLHHYDAYARGSAGAGTFTRPANQPGAAPLGQRPVID